MFSKILFQSLRFFILGFIAIVVSVGFLYLTDYLLPKTKYTYEGDMLYGIDANGYAIIKPNTTFKETLHHGESMLFSEVYTTDHLGMRKTPSSQPCADNHLFLIGASLFLAMAFPMMKLFLFT